jgi:hypothetical protein
MMENLIGLDELFKNRLNADNVYYADGHMSIETSNHVNMLNFYCSAKNIINAFPSCWEEAALKYGSNILEFVPYIGKSIRMTDFACDIPEPKLNTTPNIDGFNKRTAQGTIAGQTLLTTMQADENINKNSNGEIIDTLDIVCHSMGYAYALGMIEALDGKVPFGRLYIIAPENAGSGGTDWTKFTEVWQYGTDEKNEPIEKQDGVAPQTNAMDLPDGRRIYIPTDGSIPRV